MRQRAKLGDIFALKTKKGEVYLHYVYRTPNKHVELVKILQGFHRERPVDLCQLTQQPEQFILDFTIGGAFWRGMVERVGHCPVEGFTRPSGSVANRKRLGGIEAIIW